MFYTDPKRRKANYQRKMNEQVTYISICLFSRRALISAPSTVSKYIHHKLNAIPNPSPADIIEGKVQLWDAIPLTTPSIKMPKTIIVNDPKRSGKWCTLGANCT